MAASESLFCPKCGGGRKKEARFCGSCGFQFAAAPVPERSGADLKSVAGKVMSATSKAGLPQSPLPSWEVVVGEKLPVFAPLPQTSLPAMHGLSLKGLAWSVAVTAAMDIAATLTTHNPAAMKTITLRAVLATATLLAGVAAGSQRPWAAIIMVIASLSFSLVQVGNIASSFQQLANTLSSSSAVLPNLITQGVALVAAVRTVWFVGRQYWQK